MADVHHLSGLNVRTFFRHSCSSNSHSGTAGAPLSRRNRKRLTLFWFHEYATMKLSSPGGVLQ